MDRGRPLRVDVYHQGRYERTEWVGEGATRIGRLSTADLRLQDPDVARMHAVLEVRAPDDVWVVDSGRRGGTRVNGHPIVSARLSPGDRLDLGASTLLVHVDGPAARADRPPGATADPSSRLRRPLAAFVDLDPAAFGSATLLHALFLAVVFLVPPDVDGLSIGRPAGSDRFLELVVRAERPAPPTVAEPFDRPDPTARPAGKTAQGSRSDPGALGRPDAPDRPQRRADKGPKDPAHEDAVRRRVRSMAVFQRLKGLAALTTSGPTGDDPSAGPVTAAGRPLGLVIGATRGTHGYDVFGTDSGLRTGDLASVGLAPGSGRPTSVDDAPRAPCSGSACARRTLVPEVAEPPEAPDAGRIDRPMIRRVLSRHRAEMRACYEQELQHTPGLEGRVVVRFAISPFGRVLSADVAASTLGHAQAEGCIVARVRRLVFPTPKSGGVVEVRYPFYFRPLGGR